MNTIDNAAEAYAELDRALRGLTEGPSTPVDVPAHFLKSIATLLTQAQTTAVGGAAAQKKEQVKILCRWLWNRGLTSDIMGTFGPQARTAIEQAAGLGAVDDSTLWGRALGLTRKVENVELEEPDNPKVVRHNMDEHALWAPAAAPAVEAPSAPVADEETVTPIKTPAADPFKYGAVATANRKAKAKTLARWLWDRNINYDMFLNFTSKQRNAMARAAGVNPPSGMDSWEETFAMISKMEVREAANPDDPATARHALDEHEQWANQAIPASKAQAA